MKKGKMLILALCFSIIALIYGSLGVTAASSYAIAEDFAADSDCEFLVPGDMNADGKVGADDLVMLKQLLLSNTKDSAYTEVYKTNGKTAKYSDINGDDFVDIKDLVRQKKNSAKNFAFVDDGVMSLNGNSAFNGAFNSALGTGAVYEISITYKSDSPITVKMADLEKEIVFDAKATASKVTKTFETPVTIADTEGIEFQIIGVASIENISVNRANMDNDLVDNW